MGQLSSAWFHPCVGGTPPAAHFNPSQPHPTPPHHTHNHSPPRVPQTGNKVRPDLEAPYGSLRAAARKVARAAADCKMEMDVEEYVDSFRPGVQRCHVVLAITAPCCRCWRGWRGRSSCGCECRRQRAAVPGWQLTLPRLAAAVLCVVGFTPLAHPRCLLCCCRHDGVGGWLVPGPVLCRAAQAYRSV